MQQKSVWYQIDEGNTTQDCFYTYITPSKRCYSNAQCVMDAKTPISLLHIRSLWLSGTEISALSHVYCIMDVSQEDGADFLYFKRLVERLIVINEILLFVFNLLQL